MSLFWNLGILLAFVFVPIGLLWLCSHMVGRYADDAVIDDLIKANRDNRLARQAERGLDKPDWTKINRAGGRVWAQKLQGQRRYNQPTISMMKKTG